MSQQIKLTDIRYSGTQTRVEVNADAIAEYTERFEAGSPFPEIDVYHQVADDGHDIYWLGDGMHRVTVATMLEHETIAANVMPGGKREALEHSIKSNWSHGVRRTVADKQLAVRLALADDVWREWSDNRLAEFCGVSHTFVASVRSESGCNVATGKRIGRDGKPQAATKRTATRLVSPAAAEAPPVLTPSNGKAEPASTSFNTATMDKPTKSRTGKQKVKPADRKAALKAYGGLVRALDRIKVSPDVEQQLNDILAAIKAS